MQSAQQLAADVIVASGDFTQRAKARQFADARAFLDRLPKAPLVVVPGNHDVPLYRVYERIFTPYALYQRHISPNLQSTLQLDRAVLVALNTTDPMRRITNGRITTEQLDYCAAAFAAAPSQAIRIVVAHHHFAPPPDYRRDGGAMGGARRALDRFNELGVELILGGHLHRAYIGNSLDVYPSNDRIHGIVIVQSGTSTSQRGRAREREKNSFNLIRIDDDVLRITHYMFFHELGGFRPISCHVFPRRSRRVLDQPPLEQPPLDQPRG